MVAASSVTIVVASVLLVMQLARKGNYEPLVVQTNLIANATSDPIHAKLPPLPGGEPTPRAGPTPLPDQ
jgi:hypothetical protein